MPAEHDQHSVLEQLARLHDHKTVGYGDAWRKRGELLSIFTNIARKYDRLVVALDEHVTSNDEGILDTAADLCVYGGKYLTWLAECHPREFTEASAGARAKSCADSSGPGALREIFGHLDTQRNSQTVEPAWQSVKAAFEPLEHGLLAEAGAAEGIRLGWVQKTTLAWALTNAANALTLAVSLQRSAELQALEATVREMDAATGP
jgi:hypothetical protein